MRKMFLLSFALMVAVFVSCERQDLYEDEPYEPMEEDFIREEIANPFGVVKLNEEQARKIVEDYLDGINVNFSTGEVKIIENEIDSIEMTTFRFEVYYKKVWVDGHRITLHPMRDHETDEFSTTQVLITGTSLFYNDISVKPRLSKKEALECLKQSDSKITDEVIESKPELLIHKDLGEAPHLAYMITVDISTFDRWDYYVSAQTGEVLDRSYQGAVE